MTRYTPVPGTLALREEICKKLLRDNALSYKPENIVVSNGAKQSLFNALSASSTRAMKCSFLPLAG